MAIRLSDAAAALMAGDVGLRRALANAHMVFYTGAQPTSANSAKGTAQPIVAFTNADGVLTEEALATWVITFSGITGTAGLSSIALDNAELLGSTVTSTTLALVADGVATAINANVANAGFTATSDGISAVTITAPKGSGTAFNSCLIVATTSGTITATETGAGAVVVSGVAAVNGLTFSVAADGASLTPAESNFYIAKPVGEVWKGKNGFGPATAAATAVFTGIVDATAYTAGWGRICATPGDSGESATSGASGAVRVDFSIGTTSEDFVISPSAALTINTASGSEIESSLTTFKLKVAKQPAV